MVTDPIGDFITRLKNASAVKKPSLSVPYSNMKYAIALTLKKSGYIGDVAKVGDGPKKVMTVALLYGTTGDPKIQEVKRISKPGRRMYTGVSKIHPVKYGKGLMVLTTPKGILTDAEARRDRVGGETLFAIW